MLLPVPSSSLRRSQHTTTSKVPSDTKVDAIEPSECSANLILRADSLLEQFLLNVNCVGSKRMLVTHSVLERIKTEQKPYRERRTRTQTGSSGQVGNMVNFDTLVDAKELETAPHRGMLDRVVTTDIFNLRVGDAAVILKEGRHSPTSDVAAAIVNGGRQYGPRIPVLPDRMNRCHHRKMRYEAECW